MWDERQKWATANPSTPCMERILMGVSSAGELLRGQARVERRVANVHNWRMTSFVYPLTK